MHRNHQNANIKNLGKVKKSLGACTGITKNAEGRGKGTLSRSSNPGNPHALRFNRVKLTLWCLLEMQSKCINIMLNIKLVEGRAAYMQKIKIIAAFVYGLLLQLESC